MSVAAQAVVMCARRVALGTGELDAPTREATLEALLDRTDGIAALEREIKDAAKTWSDRAAFEKWIETFAAAHGV